ncbi:MAG: hypothetical protein SFX73_22310 [Kofleriaceae bacterium]|nr:hypothetical protein [Kofleriaceae bacterium]
MRVLLALAAALAGCAPSPPSAGAELGTSRNPAPVEPQGHQCLSHADVAPVLETLRRSAAAGVPQLVAADCLKRTYVAGPVRFVIWGPRGQLHGKGSSATDPRPSTRCIDRALALAHELAPFAATILGREAVRNAAMWRDPEVGAVSYVRCDPLDEPMFTSVGTMLHETNHALAQGRCIFDFAAERELCLDLDPALPRGVIAIYARPPVTLDANARKWLAHVQTLYLERNGQGLLELLDEVVAYRATAEWTAIGLETNRFGATGPPAYINLPLMMALITRYVNELAVRDPALAAREFGPHGRNRAAVLDILDGAEVSYQRWLRATKKPSSFERTFWDDYQRGRQRWLRP